MKDLKDQFRKIGIVPVVVLDDAKDAAPLAKALMEGGLPCAEVTKSLSVQQLLQTSSRT